MYIGIMKVFESDVLKENFFCVCVLDQIDSPPTFSPWHKFGITINWKKTTILEKGERLHFRINKVEHRNIHINR